MITLTEKDIKRIENASKEYSYSCTRHEAERDLRQAMVEDVHDDTGVDKKYLRQIFNLYHKSNFVEKTTENDEIETLYETVYGSQS